MKTRISLLLLMAIALLGCNPHVPGQPGVPEPIKVLENPKTGERARFFREVSFKTPKGYDEKKHIVEWTAEKNKSGFTKEISPVDDRPVLAEERRKNKAKR